ncbi:MAG: PaaI family thioesterase [Deltaproteobacteria bacterium]|nr:MAG: PaaI family thioesterase [Deltaproteobacteria bacterium]
MDIEKVDIPAEAGWQEFDAPALVGETLRFVSGDRTGRRFQMRYFRNAEGHLVARVWFGPETEGPPGHAHGGSIAAVFDEVLGLAAWAAGYPIVVGNLNISFRHLLPLRTIVQVDSEVVEAAGRKVKVRGRITLGDKVLAEADCLCITLPEEKRGQLG